MQRLVVTSTRAIRGTLQWRLAALKVSLGTAQCATRGHFPDPQIPPGSGATHPSDGPPFTKRDPSCVFGGCLRNLFPSRFSNGGMCEQGGGAPGGAVPPGLWAHVPHMGFGRRKGILQSTIRILIAVSVPRINPRISVDMTGGASRLDRGVDGKEIAITTTTQSRYRYCNRNRNRLATWRPAISLPQASSMPFDSSGEP